jgi:hypothetical protein
MAWTGTTSLFSHSTDIKRMRGDRKTKKIVFNGTNSLTPIVTDTAGNRTTGATHPLTTAEDSRNAATFNTGNGYYYSGDGAENTQIHRYDITANSWSAGLGHHGVAYYPGMAIDDVNNKAYFLDYSTTEFVRLDLANATTTNMAASPSPLFNALVYRKGKIYVFPRGVSSQKVMVYDIASNTWGSSLTAPSAGSCQPVLEVETGFIYWLADNGSLYYLKEDHAWGTESTTFPISTSIIKELAIVDGWLFLSINTTMYRSNEQKLYKSKIGTIKSKKGDGIIITLPVWDISVGGITSTALRTKLANGKIGALDLVPTTDASASPFRIYHGGAIKAIQKE